MSKVICDVCGTTYPETASNCPICGCAKNSAEQTMVDSEPGAEGTYAPVKGGRFSKRNVRKRNKVSTREPVHHEEDADSIGTNKGLVAVVVVLLLAIIAVLIYIGVRFVFPDSPKPSDPVVPNQTTTAPPITTTAPTTPAVVPCTGLKLSSTTVELSVEGGAWLLSVEATPANTTDKITFSSSNELVATVSENGNITGVGGGEAIITVKCGDVTAECKVRCTFAEPVGPTTEPTTVPPVTLPAGFKLELRRTDITISKQYPDPVSLYKKTEGVEATDITWTSDNPEIASVDEKGVVSPVGKGNTVIRATIGDQTASCKVIVAFQPEEEVEPAYKLNYTDVTIEVGATVTLRLTDEAGANVTVEWTASEEGFVTIDGNRITGTACGEDNKVKRIEVSTTYEGETYTCIVRIKPKAEEKPE